MNILITSYDPQPQFIGGDKRVSITLANIWKRKGHQVKIICFSPSQIKKKTVEGIEQLFLPDETMIDAPNNVKFLRQAIAEQKIDILLHQHALIRDYNRLCSSVKDGIKIVSVVHYDIRHDIEILANSFFIKYKIGNNIRLFITDILRYGKYILHDKSKLKKYIKEKYKELYNTSDMISLLSDTMLDQFRKYIGQPNADRITAINNPVIPIKADCQNIRKKEMMVVLCGRLEYGQKRTDRMLQIWKKIHSRHPNWQLKILGSGDWNYYQSLINRYDIRNVEIVGFCNPSEYYNKAAILCMTSTTEGFPMVLVEAQSYGCVPIAYNNFFSLNDIITDGENGFSIKPFDENEYVRKLSMLMDNQELRLQMSANCINSINRFNADDIADKWLILFDKLLKK